MRPKCPITIAVSRQPPVVVNEKMPIFTEPMNMPITAASVEAGFGSYSNFYKLYKKENGCAPSDELKAQPNNGDV